MSKLTDKLSAEWQDTANLVLGLWLIVSPYLLAFSGEPVPTRSAILVGVVIAAAAAVALTAFQMWEASTCRNWVNVALAAWLVVSPWLLGFAGLQPAMWSHVLTGVLVGILALWSTTIEHGGNGIASKG